MAVARANLEMFAGVAKKPQHRGALIQLANLELLKWLSFSLETRDCRSPGARRRYPPSGGTRELGRLATRTSASPLLLGTSAAICPALSCTLKQASKTLRDAGRRKRPSVTDASGAGQITNSKSSVMKW